MAAEIEKGGVFFFAVDLQQERGDSCYLFVHGFGCCGGGDPPPRHNDANMLAMGAGIIGPNMAERIVDVFLDTQFEGGRHEKRIAKLMAIENR